MDQDCHIEPVSRVAAPTESDRREVAIFAVLGMGCPNCAIRIENKLVATQGVLDAHFDHIADMGVVVFNPELVNTKALTELVSQAGDGDRHEYAAWLLTQ